MLSRFVSIGLAALLAIATFAAPVSAQDGDREAARAEFARGVEAYGRADYQVALTAFQEAYRLAPHPNVRVNIANCYEHLNRPLEALFHFEHFLSEAERPPVAQRREVEAAVRRLSQLVGAIQLHVVPDGATVTIDSTETRRAPVSEPVRVTTGRHTIDVQMEGYQAEHQVVDVVGGQTARVEVRLRRADAVVASGTGDTGTTGATTTTTTGAGTTQTGTTGTGTETTTTTTTTTTAETETEVAVGTTVPMEEPAPEPRSGRGFQVTPPMIIAGAATVAFAIGAGVMGGLALSANSDFESQVAIYEDPAQPADVREQARIDGESAASNARTFALVSDVFLITTIVGVGATVFFTITTQDGGMLGEPADGERASSAQPTLVVLPVISNEVAGVAMSGSF